MTVTITFDGCAAAPAYVNERKSDIARTPPGHRFSLYFPLWNKSTWDAAQAVKTEVRNDGRDKTSKLGDGKQRALKQVLQLGADASEQLRQLRARQARLAELAGAITLDAVSEAPFMTGVGMEHPLENGFAFLNPYGLAYLPGASVKGVLRQAAEALALQDGVNDRGGWDIAAVWWLFGFDATSACLDKAESEAAKALRAAIGAGTVDRELAARFEPLSGLIGDGPAKERRREIHLKGALAFWDVLPEPAGGALAIDILTPHHSPYYQKGLPPADCYGPNPVPFLTVPPESRFRFHVQLLDRPSLPARLRETWRELIETAFEHALAWHGFGAKTAVGYGQMRRLEAEEASSAATKPIQVQKAAFPKGGTEVEVVLLAEKTKKDKWKASHEESGNVSHIDNSDEMPADCKAGDRIAVMVSGSRSFLWPTDEVRARAAKPGGRTPGRTGPGKRRGRR
jgi:CRISPR-associated protein Cmr6